MPFKSKAQQRKCYAMKAKGQAGSWDCSEWSDATNFKKLPEKVSQQLPQIGRPDPRDLLPALRQATGQGAAIGGLLGFGFGAGRAPDKEGLRGGFTGGVRGALQGAGSLGGGIGGLGLGASLGHRLGAGSPHQTLATILGSLVGGGGGFMLGDQLGDRLGTALVGPPRDRKYNVKGDDAPPKLANVGLAGGGQNAPSSYAPKMAPSGSLSTQNMAQAMSKFAALAPAAQLHILRSPRYSLSLKQAFVQQLPAVRREELRARLAA